MSIRAVCVLGVALAGTAADGASAAEEGSLASEQDYLGDVPVVLSAARLRQPVSEAPVTVSVIDREMIQASGFRQIPDLLRLVPGMMVANSSDVNGVVPIITYHGLTDAFARRMQVLVDGRAVHTPLWGMVQWDDLPLAIEDVERIEVVRGPNASSYGANSFFGVINIITRQPLAGDRGVVSTRIGERGVRDGIVRLAASGSDVAVHLTGGYRADNGFDDVYDNKRQRFVSGRATWHESASDLAEFEFGLSHGARGAGFPERPIEQPRDKHIDHGFAQVSWQHTVTPENEIRLQASDTRLMSHEIENTLPIPGLASFFLETNYREARQEVEVQQTLGFGPSVRVNWGAGARSDRVVGKTWFWNAVDESASLYRAFSNAEWHVTPRLLLQGGAMVERYSLTGTDVSPRLAANFHITPDNTVRASVSRALRDPLLIEQRGDFRLPFPAPIPPQRVLLGGGNLEPERITSVEVGYLAALPAQGLKFNFKLYQDHVTNIIDNLRVPLAANFQPLQIPANLYGARVHGLEAEMEYRPVDSLRLLASAARTRVNSEGSRLEETTPPNIVSLFAIWRATPNWTVSSGYYLQSATRSFLDAQHRLDARIAYRWSLCGHRAEVALVGQSLLRDYMDYRTNQVFNRLMMTTFELEL